MTEFVVEEDHRFRLDLQDDYLSLILTSYSASISFHLVLTLLITILLDGEVTSILVDEDNCLLPTFMSCGEKYLITL